MFPTRTCYFRVSVSLSRRDSRTCVPYKDINIWVSIILSKIRELLNHALSQSKERGESLLGGLDESYLPTTDPR